LDECCEEIRRESDDLVRSYEGRESMRRERGKKEEQTEV
jgi:hypothetical protein